MVSYTTLDVLPDFSPSLSFLLYKWGQENFLAGLLGRRNKAESRPTINQRCSSGIREHTFLPPAKTTEIWFKKTPESVSGGRAALLTNWKGSWRRGSIHFRWKYHREAECLPRGRANINSNTAAGLRTLAVRRGEERDMLFFSWSLAEASQLCLGCSCCPWPFHSDSELWTWCQWSPRGH